MHSVSLSQSIEQSDLASRECGNHNSESAIHYVINGRNRCRERLSSAGIAMTAIG
jgi:hypothetical protein